MTTTPHTTIRIPVKLRAKLQEESKRTERTQTDIILTALNEYLKEQS